MGLPRSFIAGYRTKSICEHVKLALGLLLHCSSRVYFKRRKNWSSSLLWVRSFQLFPAETVHLTKINAVSEQRRWQLGFFFNVATDAKCWVISCACQENCLLTSSHSAVKDGVLSNLPSGLAPSRGLGLPGPWPRDPDPQLCSSCKKKKQNKTLCA